MLPKTVIGGYPPQLNKAKTTALEYLESACAYVKIRKGEHALGLFVCEKSRNLRLPKVCRLVERLRDLLVENIPSLAPFATLCRDEDGHRGIRRHDALKGRLDC